MPCVAVMNIYSAASPSYENELHNALCSAMTASQQALDLCHAFLHMTVRCDYHVVRIPPVQHAEKI